MANKPLQSIKFPNLPDTYTVPVVDSTLAVSGAAADAKKTGDELAKKVNAVSGKGLSTNDFTTTEKNKLSGIESGANKTVIDSTLAVSGNAADAKAVGDALAVVDRNAYGAYIIPTASGPIAHFTDGADNIPMKDVLVHIEPVQEGSGDPSPDNVRPITGWTRARVTRAGKNILLPARTTGYSDQNGVRFDYAADGTITASGTATANAYTTAYDQVGLIFHLPPGRYIKSGASGNFDGLLVQYVDPADYLHWITIGTPNSTSFTVTEEQSKCNIIVRVRVASGKTLEDEVYKPYLAFESSGFDYEPYSGSTYSVTFPASAGTVYGGTLDVTSGVLTVTHKLYTFDGSENWTAGNYGLRYEFNLTGLPDYIKTYNSGGRGMSNLGIYDSTAYNTPDKNYITSRTNVGASAIGVKNHALVVPPSVATTVEEFKAFLANTPEQWYAPLQTPQTYQLTPQEITSLLGQNNVWADTGDTEVEYRADTALYIGRLTEPNADMIADSNITSGQYFMVGNSLYRATSNIASGASVVVGTNAVKVSLATALNEINQ